MLAADCPARQQDAGQAMSESTWSLHPFSNWVTYLSLLTSSSFPIAKQGGISSPVDPFQASASHPHCIWKVRDLMFLSSTFQVPHNSRKSFCWIQDKPQALCVECWQTAGTVSNKSYYMCLKIQQIQKSSLVLWWWFLIHTWLFQ